jgi:hypothetical protein
MVRQAHHERKIIDLRCLCPFVLSRIFACRSKGVGKKQGGIVVTFAALLLDKDRLSTGAIEPAL